MRDPDPHHRPAHARGQAAARARRRATGAQTPESDGDALLSSLRLQSRLEIEALGGQIARAQLLLSRRVLAFCLAHERHVSAAHWITDDVARRVLRPLCQARAALGDAYDSIGAGAFSTAHDTSELTRPALGAAQQGLRRLCKADLTEIASMRRPPQAVETVAQLVAVLTGRAPPGARVGGQEWDTVCRPMMRDRQFLTGLVNFDHDNVPDVVLRRVQRGLASAHASGVSAASVAKCSSAAVSLLAWVEGTVKYAAIASGGDAALLTLPKLAAEVRALSATMARMGDDALVRTSYAAPRLLPLMQTCAPRLSLWQQRGGPGAGDALQGLAPGAEPEPEAAPAAAAATAPAAAPVAVASRGGRAGALVTVAESPVHSHARSAARKAHDAPAVASPPGPAAAPRAGPEAAAAARGVADVLLAFYATTRSDFANDEKVERVMAHFRRRGGEGEGWVHEMYDALAAQYGVRPAALAPMVNCKAATASPPIQAR